MADDTEVGFWSRKVKRSNLVKHMTKSMALAAGEYNNNKDGRSGKDKNKLYL